MSGFKTHFQVIPQVKLLTLLSKTNLMITLQHTAVNPAGSLSDLCTCKWTKLRLGHQMQLCI